MKFCNYCGHALEYLIPEGDNRKRYVCVKCNAIHYQNPKIIAGTLTTWENKLLLCKRAIEPQYGLWTLPAGFMENNETTLEAAKRETMEEAGATVQNPELYCIYNIPHISQVYIIYKGRLQDGIMHPGEESIATRLFSLDEIPWDQIAFRVIYEVLRQYETDTKNGTYKLHTGDIIRHEDMSYSVTNPT